MGLLTTGGLIALSAVFYQYVLHSSYFSLKETEIVAGERFPKERVQDFVEKNLGVAQGTSLLTIDSSHIRKELEAAPEIASADVQLLWPHTLLVTIEDRVAEGIVSTTTASYVYDDRGYIFAPATGKDFMSLRKPMITGFDSAVLEPGRTIPQTELRLIEKYNAVFAKAAPSIYLKISEFNWDSEQGLTLIFAEGEKFVCGTKPPEETGPLVETLLNTTSDDGPINSANLLADGYFTIMRAGTRTALARK
ncbi:hypothetical protein BH09SUM1_BH09SUM1_11970 [soil metagenome]